MVEEIVVTIGIIALIIGVIVLFIQENRKKDKETPSPVIIEPPVIEPTPPVVTPPVIEPTPPVVTPPVIEPTPPVVTPPVIEPTPPVVIPPVIEPTPPAIPEGIILWGDGRWWFENEFYPSLEAAIIAKEDFERRLREREENLRRGEQELVNRTFNGILFVASLNEDDLAYLYAMSHKIRLKYPTGLNVYYDMGLLSGTHHDMARAINAGEQSLIGRPTDFMQNYNGILKTYLQTIFENGHL